MKCQLFWSVDRPRSCATGDHALVRMLRKLTVSYGPTEMLYIWASPGGLPASEASPSRQADCGTGTTGRRRPPPVESVLTGGPDRRRPGSIYTSWTTGYHYMYYLLLPVYAHSICECHSRGCHTVSRMEHLPYGRFYYTRSG